MPRTSTARDRLIKAASRLFQRRGYHGTGITEILTESNAPKGSFYHHFPDGKEELAAVAIAIAGEQIGDLIDACFVEGADFSEGAARVAEAIGAWFEQSDFAEGCPITSVLLELTPSSSRLSQTTQSVFEAWCGRVETHATKFGMEKTHARTVSVGLVLAIEGAWILSRAQRSREPFTVAARMVAALAD